MTLRNAEYLAFIKRKYNAQGELVYFNVSGMLACYLAINVEGEQLNSMLTHSQVFYIINLASEA